MNGNRLTNFLGICTILFGVACNASAGIFIRIITANHDLNLITASMYRFMLSVPILFLYLFLFNTKLTKIECKDVLLIILSGVCFALGALLYNSSFIYTTIANANLFSNLPTLIVVPISVLFFKEKVPWFFLVPVGFIILGTLLVVSDFQTNTGSFINFSANLWGDLLAFSVSIVYGLYIVLISKLRRYIPNLELMSYCSLVAGVTLIIISYFNNAPFIPQYYSTYFAIVGLALITHLLGAVVIAFGMGFISPILSSILIMMQPMVGLFYGWLFYNETIFLHQFIGIIITVAAIVYAQSIIDTNNQDVQN